MAKSTRTSYIEHMVNHNSNIDESEALYNYYNQEDNIRIDLFSENAYKCCKPESDSIIDNLIELEIRAFQNKKEYGGITNTLNKFQFENIIKHLNYIYIQNGTLSEPVKAEHSLDINIHNNNYVNHSDEFSKLRFTIAGKSSILDFCKSNKIPDKCPLIYKDKLQWSNDIDKSMITTHNLSSDKATVDLPSTKLRLDGKLEIPFNYSKGRFDFKNIVNNSKILEHMDKSNEIYRQYTIKKNSVYKSFRLKERYSFYIDDHIRIDLTKVKSSKKDIDFNYFYNVIPVKKFIDSDIGSQNETYEFEIEIINIDNITSSNNVSSIIKKAINIVKSMYSVIEERVGYTYNNLSNDVLYIYKEFIKTFYIQKVENKKNICKDALYLKNSLLTKEQISSINEKYSNLTYSYFHIIKDESVTSINNKIGLLESSLDKIIQSIDKNKVDTLFISPKVVSISMDHIRPENPYSIMENYCITDKADGIGSLLYKVGLSHLTESDRLKYNHLNNRLFFIDSNVSIRDTGIQTNTTDGSCIFNGEFLNYNKIQNSINKYGIYDAYVINNLDITSIPLISESDIDTRLSKASESIRLINSNIVENIHDLNIFIKKFILPNNKSDIFNSTKQIWDQFVNDKTEYYLDGTIYTPIHEPVAYNDSKSEYDLYPGTTWYRNLKWKPPEDNTIDFLIRIETEIVNNYSDKNIVKFKIKHIPDPEGVGLNKYYITNLYNTGRVAEQLANPCNSKSSSKYGKTKPIIFNPDNDDSNRVLFKLHRDHVNNKEYIVDNNGIKVEDNTIVEVQYVNFNPSLNDYESNKEHRFKILRTRHDKTYMHRAATEYQEKTIKIIQKVIYVAEIKARGKKLSKTEEQFWNKNVKNLYKYGEKIPNINAFIKDISNKKDSFKTYEDIDNFPAGIKANYGNSVSVAKSIWASIHNPITTSMITTGKNIPDILTDEDKYYNNKDTYRRDKSITLSLQNFHNKIIKNRILIENAVKLLRKDDHDKHLNLLDLACGKGGDIGKWIDNTINNCVGIDLFENNIYDVNNGACERYNFYKNKKSISKIPRMDFLVGDISKNIKNKDAFKTVTEKQKFTELWHTNPDYKYSSNKFNIISIMFAMHYFFKDENTLNNLITNIDENLHEDGILIGACFDGHAVFDMLKMNLINESIEGRSKGSWTWKITKNYSNNIFENNEKSLNMSIKVAMRSINKVIEEYLVNFEYFIKKLNEIGIYSLDKTDTESLMLPIIDGHKSCIGSFKDIYDLDAETIDNISLESILVELQKNLSDSEKKISFLNKYFIFKRGDKKTLLTDKIRKFILDSKNLEDYNQLFLDKNWDKMSSIVYKDMKLNIPDSEFHIYYKQACELIELNDLITSPLVTPSISKSDTESSVKSPTTSSVKSPTTSSVKSPTTSLVESDTTSSVKSPTKSSVESPSKSSVKSPSKSSVKSPTKSSVKSGTKSLVKSDTESSVKSDTKSSVKSGTKSTVKSDTPLSSSNVVESGSNFINIYEKSLQSGKSIYESSNLARDSIKSINLKKKHPTLKIMQLPIEVLIDNTIPLINQYTGITINKTDLINESYYEIINPTINLLDFKTLNTRTKKNVEKILLELHKAYRIINYTNHESTSELEKIKNTLTKILNDLILKITAIAIDHFKVIDKMNEWYSINKKITDYLYKDMVLKPKK